MNDANSPASPARPGTPAIATPSDPKRTLTSAEIKVRLVNLLAVTLPFVGLIVAIVLLWGVAFNWIYLALMVGMYLVTASGITIGFHRLLTHRAFKTSRPVAAILTAMGSMAVQGPVLQWVATHRRHHHHSDEEDDPHSPHTHGDGWWGTIRGLWYAHVGWVISTYTFVPARNGAIGLSHNLAEYVGDLRKDPMLRWMNRTFPLWVMMGLLIPAVLGGVITMTWTGALLGFIWGGLVRIFLVHHVTWSINSVCHIWGTRPFRSDDESRNNAIFGILALGEGWHNNHHAFPTSARHGLRWWQLDVSYLLIRAMALVGLAYDVRVPSPERLAAKRAG